MTLANYSKTILLSLELQEDAGPRLLNFLLNWIARCQAKTYNQLLLAAVAATGTSYKTAASATAIVAGELETVCDNDSVGFYEEEDAPSIAWVMKPSTFRAIKAITGNPRLYGDYADGKRQLLEYPVCLSSKAGAMTAGLKPVYFGNWRFVAYRETGLSILRDPFSAASTGQIRIWLNFQTVFKVLQPAAVGYLIMHT
jgi:HK97 family phage major capsid protein